MKQQSISKFPPEQTFSSKIQSIDGPPLDFSFKNIRSLSQLTQNMPSSIHKQTASQQPAADQSQTQKSPNPPISQISQTVPEAQPQQKLQIIRTIQPTDMHPQTISKPNKTIPQWQPKKYVQPITTSLFLRYNKLTSVQNFIQFVQPVFPQLTDKLMWLDLSHNRIVSLGADLAMLKAMKTLYLHANYISSFQQLAKLKHIPLRTLTIHANPLENYEQFRIIIRGIMPGLKKIDSTLLTKRQNQRAQVLMKTMKKFPIIKNPKLPPEESENQGDDDD